MTTERVGIVVWRIAHGHAYSTREIAVIAEITPRAALDMLNKLSRVVPIYRDEHNIWRASNAVFEGMR